MKKNILIIIGTVAVFAGLFWLQAVMYESANTNGAIDPQANLKPSVLSVSEKQYNFGSISMAKGNVSHKFQIKNTTAEAVMLTKIFTSCMCTTAVLMKGGRQFGPFGMPGHGGPAPSINETLQPNEEAVLEVIFNPAAHGPAGVGQIARSIYVENNISTPLELQFSALVTP